MPSGGSTLAGSGGVNSAAGTNGIGSSGAGSGAAGTAGGMGSCGSSPLNPNPFGCSFAWGLSDTPYGFLQFATTWIETGMKADGSYSTCGGCKWIKDKVASTNLIPVYYAYIIGFMGHAAGLVDGNQCPADNPNCATLVNGGAALIKANRDKIVQAYASYAAQSHAAWPTKPLVWMLEGDFVQFTSTSQSSPLTMAELGQLTADIACAIKSNMPNAVVALDHSTWNPDQTTDDYWNAMKNAGVRYDMVWTTGVANNNDYLQTGQSASSYNGKTATYAYLHQLTGKTIMVDDGCGANTDEDWSKASASVLNARIASGVVGFTHCGSLEASYQSLLSSLGPQLSSTCH
jgi:hypothetical protein